MLFVRTYFIEWFVTAASASRSPGNILSWLSEPNVWCYRTKYMVNLGRYTVFWSTVGSRLPWLPVIEFPAAFDQGLFRPFMFSEQELLSPTFVFTEEANISVGCVHRRTIVSFTFIGEVLARSTIEVVHFRDIVSEGRGSSTQSRRNPNVLSKPDVFRILGR